MRISQENLTQYVREKIKNNKILHSKIIIDFPMLLQNDYGLAQDCSLTSMTALVQYKKYYPSYSTYQIYDIVEKIALKYGYDGNKKGTYPIFIKKILNEVCSTKSVSTKILKGIGYNYDTIKEQIDKKNPIILSLYKSGNDSYTNHSVTIIGYIEYNGVRMLAVADNWCKSCSYIDYDELSIISQINYL